jgi:hypothetical protein
MKVFGRIIDNFSKDVINKELSSKNNWKKISKKWSQ